VKHNIPQADQGRCYLFSFCHFSAYSWPHLWLSSAQRCRSECFCAAGSCLYVPNRQHTNGERGPQRSDAECPGSHRSSAAEPRATYSSCKSSRNTQAAQPLRSRTAGKLLLLRGKGRGGHKKMDLFISPYAGMHNSPLFSTWLFNFHAPLTLFLVWNFIYVSIDESAIYK